MTELGTPHDASLRPVCGILGIAVLTETPFPTVFNLYRTLNCKRANWKGASHAAGRRKVVEHLGYKIAEKFIVGMSLQTWVAKHAKPGVRYMVMVYGHIVIVEDGLVTDQGGTKPVSLHRRRLARPQYEWTVTK